MTQQAERARAFARLHRPGQPLLMPNAWDAGSAKLLAGLGFEALATTSSGFAATLGRLDGSVTREQAVEHSAAMVAATNLPVSADLESGFAEDPNGVAETAGGAVAAGLAGFSIEDFAGDGDEPIYPLTLAVERVAAAAEVAHAGPAHLVLTARCENFLHGRSDLNDTIARLRAYQGAGADVLFAPGLAAAEHISTVLSALDKPLNVLVGSQSPPVAELAALGVSRISVGGAFAFAALSTLLDAARELRDQGTYGYTARAAEGMRAAREAFD